VATGFLRIYNNKHWLSGVLAGAVVGIRSADFSYFIYPQLKKIFKKNHREATIILPVYQQQSFQLALLHHF
jgi:hypothetical protein